MTTFLRRSSSLVLFACLLPRVAAADPGFASPPPGAPLVTERSNWDDRAPDSRPDWRPDSNSTLRVSIGPGLRFSSHDPVGGLSVALDVGARAAGVRASAAWLRASSERGLSQYDAELWIDFGAGQQLHPVVAAGAGLARVDSVDAEGEKTTDTIGVGVLRGSLDYVLPITGADARVGVDLIGSVPATPGGAAGDARPWLLTVAHVGVGF
jgi:hypothetical protein